MALFAAAQAIYTDLVQRKFGNTIYEEVLRIVDDYGAQK